MEPLGFSVLKSKGEGEREIQEIHELEGGKETEQRDIKQKPRAAEATVGRNQGSARAMISLEYQE